MARMSAKYVLVYNIIPELILAIEAESKAAPKRVADKIVQDAKSRAPVQTGYLRSSIQARSLESGKTAEIEVGAPYAAFVEFGTYKMAARPYLYPAIMAHQKDLALELVGPLHG